MDAAAMMRQCLSTDDIEDYTNWMRNEKTVRDKVKQIKKALSEVEGDSIACAHLLFSLIRLQINLPRYDERVNNGTWAEVSSLWQNAIISLPPQTRYSLETQVIYLAHQKLFNELRKVDYKIIENIGEVLPYVRIPIETTKVTLDYSAVANFTKRLFTFPYDNTFGRLEYHALRCDIITGGLNCPYANENYIVSEIVHDSSSNHINEIKKDDLIINAYKSIFKILYLKEIFFRRIDKEKDDDQDIHESDILCNNFLENPFFQDEFIELVRSYTVMNTLDERYAFFPDYNIIQLMTQEMVQFIEVVIEATNIIIRHKILNLLTEKSENIGYYWAYAKRYYETKITDYEDSKSDTLNYKGILSKCESASTIYLSDSVESLEYDSSGEEYESPRIKLDEIVSVKCFHTLQAKLKWGEFEDVLRIRFYAALRSFQVAHRRDPDIINEEFLHDSTMCRLECTPDVLVNAYKRHKRIILTRRNLATVPWAQVVSNAAIADYFSELIVSRVYELNFNHWGLIDRTLYSLMESIELSVVDHWGCTKVALISRSTLTLFTKVQCVSAYIPSVYEESIGATRLLDGFVSDVTKCTIRIILAVLQSELSHLSSAHMATLTALMQTLPYLSLDRISSAHGSVVPPAEKLANEAFNALKGYRHPSVKLLAYILLKSLSHPFVIADTVKLLQWNLQQTEGPNDSESEEEAKAPPTSSLVAFEEPLTRLQKNVDNALSEVKLCEETFKLVPFSFHHSPILGYLMLSVLLYEITEKAKGDLVQHYVEHVRKNNYADFWMRNSLRVLPEEMLEYVIDETNSVNRPTKYSEYFANTAVITVEGACQPLTVSALACRCLGGALGGVGAAGARAWWSRASNKQASVVRKLVANYISVPLRNKLFKDLTLRNLLLPGVIISTDPGNSEASCIIKIRDRTIELCVRFSSVHPLVAPRAYTPSSPFAPKTNWLTAYFHQQHGSLFNAFEMWISAVRARFECMNKCLLCFCTRHLTSGKLPSQFCPRCMNQFHERCLVHNDCPICD